MERSDGRLGITGTHVKPKTAFVVTVGGADLNITIFHVSLSPLFLEIPIHVGDMQKLVITFFTPCQPP